MPIAVGIASGLPWLGGPTGSAPFGPLALTPAAWYDGLDPNVIFDSTGAAPAGIGATVGRWNDKSGFSNHLLQASGLAQPTRGTFGLTFDGGDRFSPTTLTQGALASGFSVVVVCDAQAALASFFDNGTGVTRNLAQRGSTLSTDIQINAGATLARTGVPDLATRRAWYFGFNGASSFIKCGSGGAGGAFVQQGSAGNAGANTCADLRVGGNASNFLLTGTGSREGMGELIVVPRLLTAPEEALLYTYLQARHGIV